MPKDTPKMAGTIIKTSRRVNHTVKEMPRRIHSKLSKGLKNSSISKAGRLGIYQLFRIQAGQQLERDSSSLLSLVARVSVARTRPSLRCVREKTPPHTKQGIQFCQMKHLAVAVLGNIKSFQSPSSPSLRT